MPKVTLSHGKTLDLSRTSRHVNIPRGGNITGEQFATSNAVRPPMNVPLAHDTSEKSIFNFMRAFLGIFGSAS